ncbi:MAG: bifunctional nuclease family protein [Bacteroidales bacterium]|nr:bifunctional nuclease family protein [Bacteroidales bacterium]MBR6063017.1 bifunctional nuclease family protein [Bacteroidales bacterium]
MIELVVSDIRNAQPPSEAYALILKEKEGERQLPILIGMSEARAIVLEMNKMRPKRPTPHDLFLQLSEQCKVYPGYVLIHKFEEGVFYADIHFRKENGEVFTIDSRTSDAVVIALKTHIPIYIQEEVIDAYLSDTENLVDISDEQAEEDDEELADELEMDLSDENYDKYISTKLEEMSLEELQNLLDGAVECEDFEMASKIHDEIERRRQG